MDSTSGRRSATDLDQLRWTAEARVPVDKWHTLVLANQWSLSSGSSHPSARRVCMRRFMGRLRPWPVMAALAEGDTVVARFVCSGTHSGVWLGHPPRTDDSIGSWSLRLRLHLIKISALFG